MIKEYTVTLKDNRTFTVKAEDAYSDCGVLFLCDESDNAVAAFSLDILNFVTSKEV